MTEPKMLDRKISAFEGWIYFGFKVDPGYFGRESEHGEWLTDILQQLLIDKRPVDEDTLKPLIDMDGPL